MAYLTPPVGPRDKMQGSPTAPVTLVEYGDYQCPACGAAYGIIKAVQNAVGETLCFVFRNFPLTQVHPHAEHAAEIAEEAANAGLFWPMHDILFEHQNDLDDLSLVTYGEQLGLERRGLLEALAGSHAERIRTDFVSGVRSGVNGTPTLFVNGQRYDGLLDPESLLAALQQEALFSR